MKAPQSNSRAAKAQSGNYTRIQTSDERHPFERKVTMNPIPRSTICKLMITTALTALTLPITAMAGGTGNKARTDVEVKKSAIVNVATGQGATASSEIGSVTQSDQSQSEAHTRVRLDTTAIVNVATGKNSKAITRVGSVEQK